MDLLISPQLASSCFALVFKDRPQNRDEYDKMIYFCRNVKDIEKEDLTLVFIMWVHDRVRLLQIIALMTVRIRVTIK